MRKKEKHNQNKFYVKNCSICDATFYAKSNKAFFCSDSCKQQCYLIRKKNRIGYSGDANDGIILPVGTIPSQEMPENTLIFSGELKELIGKLSNYMSQVQIQEEMKFIERIKPIIDSKDWPASAVQLFTDDYFLEVMQINSRIYKLYAEKWESPDQNPLSDEYYLKGSNNPG
jgi:hypothetical protein